MEVHAIDHLLRHIAFTPMSHDVLQELNILERLTCEVDGTKLEVARHPPFQAFAGLFGDLFHIAIVLGSLGAVRYGVPAIHEAVEVIQRVDVISGNKRAVVGKLQGEGCRQAVVGQV